MNITVKKFNELTTDELYEILKSRAEVFLLEQNIVCQDLDDVDYECYHFFIKDKNRVTAYLRAYFFDEDKTTVKIGRVLTLDHGKGTGRILMEKALDEIKNKIGCEKVFVNAQKQAEGFYMKCGFMSVSEEFMEEGIPHIRMEYKNV